MRLRYIVGAFFALMLPGIAQTLVGGQTTFKSPAGDAAGIQTYTVSLAANTSTQLAPANANRIALEIQCETGGVAVSMAGLTLSGTGVGAGSIYIPPNTAFPYYSPPGGPTAAIIAYTATPQKCSATEWPRQ